jgi:hypothetical protein
VVNYTEPEGKRSSRTDTEADGLLGSGTFALQAFCGKVHFKNIRVKRLP